MDKGQSFLADSELPEEEEGVEGLGNGLSFRASANNVSSFFSSSTFYDPDCTKSRALDHPFLEDP